MTHASGISNMGLNNFLLKKILKIKDGRVKFFNKIDYIMFPANAMADFIQKIGEDFGEDYLFNLGYETGEDGANEMIEKLALLNNPVFMNMKVILSMFEILGFGKMDPKVIKSDRSLIYLTNHPVIEAAKIKYGSKSKICSHYRGIFSIHGEKELKIRGCKLIETNCICKGAKACEWSYNYFKKKAD